MNHKNIAIWTLAFAYLGAIGSVPNLFMDQVLGTSILFAVVTFVTCAIVGAVRRSRSKVLSDI